MFGTKSVIEENAIDFSRLIIWFIVERRPPNRLLVKTHTTHTDIYALTIDPSNPRKAWCRPPANIYKQHLIARKILAARPQRTPKDAWWLETGKRTKFKQRIYGQRRTPNCDSCTPHYASTPSVCWSDCEMLAQIFTHSSRYTKKC